MSNKKIVHFHLNFEYFDQIKCGEKTQEFRLFDKWDKRLANGEFTHIRLYRGYQKSSDDTVIDLPYLGYEVKKIIHKHFGKNQVKVCAINVDIKNKEK